ncbi:MAG: efflux RND transporter periplasmic adaptor subunit [Verrucomicrobia bacterium]|nr:efflux RND transporter periplasmic adaptor subunit [Verrucomicrobiota bacterium]
MKRIFTAVIILAAALGVASHHSLAETADHPHEGGPVAQLYTCGMHPQVIQNQPGNCPICGMKLTPMRSEAVASSAITIDPVTVQNMNFRSEAVKRGALRRTIRTYATIEFDETHMTDVTTKFGGWVEKLYADTTGQQVHRGDPLFELYSPEFYKMQREMMAAEVSAASMPGAYGVLKSAARSNLIALGVPIEQVLEIEKNRRYTTNFTVTAPQDGFLVEKMVVQGQQVEAGMKLYRIADLGTVWAQAQIYEQDLPFVTLGQEASVSLSYLPDRKFRGRVTYIYPTVDEKTRTAKIRMEFHNPGYLLKPGMFATMELRAELAGDAVLVPDSAVLRSGEKNTVFVALEGGKFEPRTVALGPRGAGNVYQVLNGLNEGERVVTSGQFMLDSESQLREAIAKMMGANPTAPTAPESASPAAAPAADAKAIYICPMPEHVSIQYDHAGKCPLCGMTLVPVSAATLGKIQPGGLVEYYACPMTADCPKPGHGDAHFDKPSRCPVCGMTLIPVMATEAKASATSETALPKLYTCPMASHADVVSDKPGDCPKCEMKLVPTSEVGHGKIAEANWIKAHQH